MKKSSSGQLFLLVTLMLFACIACSPENPPAKPTKVESEVKQIEQTTELIDINTATKQELMSLQGIGDVYAQKIIDNRPYKMKTQLKNKKIIPAETYDRIADKIIAKQSG